MIASILYVSCLCHNLAIIYYNIYLHNRYSIYIYILYYYIYVKQFCGQFNNNK